MNHEKYGVDLDGEHFDTVAEFAVHHSVKELEYT
jgi:hypothetical protein